MKSRNTKNKIKFKSEKCLWNISGQKTDFHISRSHDLNDDNLFSFFTDTFNQKIKRVKGYNTAEYRMKAIFERKKINKHWNGIFMKPISGWMFFQLRHGVALITNDISDLLVSFFCFLHYQMMLKRMRRNVCVFFYYFLLSLLERWRKKVTCKNVNKQQTTIHFKTHKAMMVSFYIKAKWNEISC